MKLSNKVLSHSSKMDNIPSFDMLLTTCQDTCNYGKSNLCYMKNNLNYYMNKKYREKLTSNTKLINTKQFYKILDKEIKKENCLKFRYFVSGDINDLNQLIKIVYVAELNKMVKFWLPTHRFDLIKRYCDLGFKIPSNLKIRISNPIPDTKTPKFLIKEYKKYGLSWSESSLNRKRVNCKASYNSKSCLENNCDKCFSDKPVTYFLHGKLAKKRFKKWKLKP